MKRFYTILFTLTVFSLISFAQLPAPVITNAPALLTSSTTATFEWDTVAEATGYVVNFNGSGFIPSTSPFIINGLTEGSHAFSVSAVDTGGFFGISANHFFTVMFIPGDVTLVSPDSGAVNLYLPVDLEWTTASGTGTIQYHFQLSTASDFSTTLIDDTLATLTRSINSLLPNTVYYWRVAAFNEMGQGNWSEINSFRTVPAPGLVYPILGSSGHPKDVKLDWTGVPNAVYYRLDVSTSSLFGSYVYQVDSLAYTEKEVPMGVLSNGTWYYWRVTAFDTAGKTIRSNVFTFRTSATGNGDVYHTLLTWVIGGNTAYTLTPSLYWYNSTYQANVFYELEYDTTSNLEHSTSKVVVSGLTNIFYTTPTLLTGRAYYWRVRAYNASGLYSAYSVTESFVTTPGNNAPVVPVLTYPTGNTTVYTISPTLYWFVSYNNYASPYTYLVKYATSLAGLTAAVPVLTSTPSLPLTGLTSGVTYYWQVSSFDGVTYSAYSTPESFTVNGGVTSPVIPIPSWPVGNPLVYTTMPTLNWYLGTWVAGLTYDVQFNTTGIFADLTPNVTGIPYYSYTFTSDLAGGTTYYWRVRSRLGADVSDYSAIQSFTVNATAFGTIPTPVLSYPVGGVLVYTTSPQLNWYTGTGGTYLYRLRYSVNVDMSDSTLVDSLSNLYYALAGLTPGQTYYWQVQAFSGSNSGAWSAPTSFSVNSGSAPVVPIVITPSSGMKVSGQNIALTWRIPESVQGLSYEIIISDNPLMNNPTVVNNISQLQNIVGQLNGSNYYWKVRSKNANGVYSSYSSTAFFKTNNATDIADLTTIPVKYEISQNYPNPFNPSTSIKFGIPEAGLVSIKIYDILGREVKSLLNEEMKAGSYVINWNGDDNSNNKLASGNYFLRITSGTYTNTIKMMLLK